MVPLIDVMLVLLVIFIITAPLLAHSIKINMPQVAAEQIEEEPKTVDLAIDASGALFWDEAGQHRRPAESLQGAGRRQAAARDPHPRRPEHPLRDAGQGHGLGPSFRHDTHWFCHHAAVRRQRPGRRGGAGRRAGASPAR